MNASDPSAVDEPVSLKTASRTARLNKRIHVSSDPRLGKRSQVECENDLLKRLVADLVLEKALLTERLRELQAQE